MILQKIGRTCRGNQNEDMDDIAEVGGIEIRIELKKQGDRYFPMARQDGKLELCPYFLRTGFCNANPNKRGYCYRHRM